MNLFSRYFTKWFELLGEFRRYRNTIVVTLLVSFLTLFQYHHRIALWILPANYRSYFVPANYLFYGLSLFLIPLLTIPLLRDADKFGMRLGKFRTWIIDVAAAWTVLLVLILIFCRSPDFLRFYPIYKPAAYAWKTFLLYQLCQLVYMFGWEFIFRGYMLFSTKKEIGIIPAVILQMLPFALLHVGKPELEVYGSVLAGLFLGMIAIRANSFIPCFILHFSVACTMDLFAVLYKAWIR